MGKLVVTHQHRISLYRINQHSIPPADHVMPVAVNDSAIASIFCALYLFQARGVSELVSATAGKGRGSRTGRNPW